MIPERYMVTAVPVDGGERVTGYYTACVEPMDEPVLLHYITDENGNSRVIHPTTIQPVKMKPIMDFGWICPNCGAQKVSDRVDYCWDCGQALAWD